MRWSVTQVTLAKSFSPLETPQLCDEPQFHFAKEWIHSKR